ncbi:helix-turn-helix transcriptional regulator [Yersinia intermedia]|uniref:helix-turn-helix domain-containing protein n=1 Tax=Yersinia intermedia TaxID=631 RepID=UPI0030D57CE6
MVMVKFQGLDAYTSMGLYYLCEKIFYNHNIDRDYLSTVLKEGNNTVIIFRSKPASLSECTCHIIEKNVITIIVLDKGWDGEPSRDEKFISFSDSIGKIEEVIQESMEIQSCKSLYKKCLYCQMIKRLTEEDIYIISMLRKGLQPSVIALVLGRSHKTVSYYKKRIMKKIGTRNTIEFYRFILVLSEPSLISPQKTSSFLLTYYCVRQKIFLYHSGHCIGIH